MDAQAQDRAHRIGQTREVHGKFRPHSNQCHDLLCPASPKSFDSVPPGYRTDNRGEYSDESQTEKES